MLLLSIACVALALVGAVLAVGSLIGLGLKSLAKKLEPVKTSKVGEMLTNEELKLFKVSECPDCESFLAMGPSAGISVNYYCISPLCGSRFNSMGPIGVERVTDACPSRAPKFENQTPPRPQPEMGPHR